MQNKCTTFNLFLYYHYISDGKSKVLHKHALTITLNKMDHLSKMDIMV